MEPSLPKSWEIPWNRLGEGKPIEAGTQYSMGELLRMVEDEAGLFLGASAPAFRGGGVGWVEGFANVLVGSCAF